jgi:superfamily II DNA or RNA helicase
MKKCFVNVRDEVYCTISGLEPQDQKFLEDKFAYMVEGAFFMPLYKLGRWDGKVRLFDKTGKIYFRLLDYVMPYIEGWDYEIEINDTRPPIRAVTSVIDTEWFLRKENLKVKIGLRPYQVDAVNAAIAATFGFIVAATGAGKTLMVAALCDALAVDGHRTMVIVPSVDLVEQTATTFRLCELDVGTYSGAGKDFHHTTVISTWQSLQNNPALLEHFSALIVDEAHGATAKVVGDLLSNHGKHIGLRWGFTGTIPKQELQQKTLEGLLGPTLYSITAAQLMQLGYLAELEIQPIEIQENVEEEFPDYMSEKSFLSKSPDRLDLLANIIIDTCSKKGNTLVLVNNIKQGQQLQKLIKDSIFLHGATDTEVRAEWYSTFADRDDLIVIATFGIASTGISIDRVFALVMIDSGKSFVRCIQSIGRSLRRGADKTKAYVLDVHSKLKWSKKHFRERNKYYKEAHYKVNKVIKL